eukprot:CAMPEP_0175763852 /NCGR_PEP_ID=MMETSP0097-20121207/67955_1 /TAXON_ID=311494 /ORGANISM="Alexandrium monilatum, Strain CCMP3105" /LENGTH=279 /DNA_ID=CAMNT_0017073603 /DNA_START=608 /DNA_END=1444 /DNA_ORIENTATION=-
MSRPSSTAHTDFSTGNGSRDCSLFRQQDEGPLLLVDRGTRLALLRGDLLLGGRQLRPWWCGGHRAAEPGVTIGQQLHAEAGGHHLAAPPGEAREEPHPSGLAQEEVDQEALLTGRDVVPPVAHHEALPLQQALPPPLGQDPRGDAAPPDRRGRQARLALLYLQVVVLLDGGLHGLCGHLVQHCLNALSWLSSLHVLPQLQRHQRQRAAVATAAGSAAAGPGDAGAAAVARQAAAQRAAGLLLDHALGGLISSLLGSLNHTGRQRTLDPRQAGALLPPPR